MSDCSTERSNMKAWEKLSASVALWIDACDMKANSKSATDSRESRLRVEICNTKGTAKFGQKRALNLTTQIAAESVSDPKRI